MEFADVFRVVFYVCLAGSIGVYGYRAYRHVAFKETRFDRAERRRLEQEATDGVTGTAGTPMTSRNEKRPAPSRGKGPSPIGRSITGSGGRSTTSGSEPSGRNRGRAEQPDATTADTASGGLVEAVIREELEKKRRATDGTGSTDADADADSSGAGTPIAIGSTTGSARSDDAGPSGEPNVTVAEALAGVALPCDLAPTSVDDADPHRTAFATTGFSPRRLRAELADELERLGYEVGAGQDAIVAATRPGASVWFEVFDDAAGTRVDGERLFPHVPSGSVAVVFTT